jgi:hypothetical protein
MRNCSTNDSACGTQADGGNTFEKRKQLMKSFQKQLFVALLFGATMATVHAERFRPRENPIVIKGYQTYTNLGFINPSNPTILEIRAGGDGGLSSLGKLKSWSDDQTGDLVSGALTATYTFEDESGDRFKMIALGLNQFEPDGRITFSGEAEVTDGTGKFRNAHGTLQFEGWARTTDPAAGTGISFVSFDGTIRGTRIEGAKLAHIRETGAATFTPPDIDYAGEGVLTRMGRFNSSVHNTAGPFNGAFVGIVDGKFTLCWSYETTTTFRDGSVLKWSGIEFVYFEVVTLADGTPAPDFTKPSVGELFQTIESGSRRCRNMEGVSFEEAEFTPVGPNQIEAEITGRGYFSR